MTLTEKAHQALTPDFAQAHTGESDWKGTLSVGFDSRLLTGAYRSV